MDPEASLLALIKGLGTQEETLVLQKLGMMNSIELLGKVVYVNLRVEGASEVVALPAFTRSLCTVACDFPCFVEVDRGEM